MNIFLWDSNGAVAVCPSKLMTELALVLICTLAGGMESKSNISTFF